MGQSMDTRRNRFNILGQSFPPGFCRTTELASRCFQATGSMLWLKKKKKHYFLNFMCPVMARLSEMVSNQAASETTRGRSAPSGTAQGNYVPPWVFPQFSRWAQEVGDHLWILCCLDRKRSRLMTSASPSWTTSPKLPLCTDDWLMGADKLPGVMENQRKFSFQINNFCTLWLSCGPAALLLTYTLYDRNYAG